MSEPEKPFVWTEDARCTWRSMDKARNRKNLSLAFAFGPYLLSSGILGIAAGAQPGDRGPLVAFGGLFLLLFVVVAPYWLPVMLYQWWKARGVFRNHRRTFRQRYGIDPCGIFPPDI